MVWLPDVAEDFSLTRSDFVVAHLVNKGPNVVWLHWPGPGSLLVVSSPNSD